MQRYSPERVRQMRRTIRAQLMETIFDDFDGTLMELPDDARALKYAKMAENPFRFFRGSAYLFYFDVSHLPFPYHTPREKPTWIQGDLHFENFGAFQARDGRIVYDINDFDEGYMGSYLYDLLRMSVSIALVCETPEFDGKQTEESIRSYLKAYYKQIRRFSSRKDDPTSLSFTEENTSGPIRKLLRKVNKKRKTDFLDGITEQTRHARRFSPSSEIVPLESDESGRLQEVWPDYLYSLDEESKREEAFYAIKDIAVKHSSGTASIGLDRYYVLIEGHRDPEGADDIVLEAKEVRAPVPAYFLPDRELFWSRYAHHGERVTATQRAMHHEADPFLGFFTLDDRCFYVRERSPYKKRVKASRILTLEDMCGTVNQMGRITAKIHARADNELQNGIIDYHAEDEIASAMGGDPDKFADTISLWAMGYAAQVHQDYELFAEWVRKRFS
ncbi:DUF2252 domain-containing protein [Paenibacillus alkalitolerans]|uniref:DUF2252 domain-containing protein n=1 Tax=Paenibacillus alkalitolerans TaxID=2799335 RepID=UPI0018F4D67E|nr:DUF2252 family protein [Paenibacillus alkalitolerans]